MHDSEAREQRLFSDVGLADDAERLSRRAFVTFDRLGCTRLDRGEPPCTSLSERTGRG